MKFFSPESTFLDFRNPGEVGFGDSTTGGAYWYRDDLIVAINVAFATGRPLLLTGRSGCGKTSLAHNLARAMKRKSYSHTFHENSEHQDLLWRFDAVRRLGDAQAAAAGRFSKRRVRETSALYQDEFAYIEPGVLWWAFDEESASRRGLPSDRRIRFPSPANPATYDPGPACDSSRSLVLLDEMDKGPSHVANSLLTTLGSLEFSLPWGTKITMQSADSNEALERPLLVITANKQDLLPPALVRRCVCYDFADHEPDELADLIAAVEGETARSTALKVLGSELGKDPVPSPAELLDSIRAIHRLEASGVQIEEILPFTLARRH